MECALAHGRDTAHKKKIRAFDAETGRRKKKIETKSDLEEKLQSVFNRFIRARDRDKKCILCDDFVAKPINGCMWDAGHFKSKQSFPELRFNELAVHREHSRCNRNTSKSRRNDKEHDARYRENLITRIGLQLVECLEGPVPPLLYTHADLRWLIEHYKGKAKQAEKDAEELSS
jgi:hypothetical protein